MVSDISTVFSGKLSRMDRKYKSLIIGSNMETHGKSKESIYNTKFILEVKSEKPLTTRVMKGLIGKKLRLS